MQKRSLNKGNKQAVARETVRIARLAQGGDGISNLADGRIVFVPRTLPGDEVEIRLIQQKKSFARGQVARILEPSVERVEAECPYFRRGCGGCQFWHTSYENEIVLKSRAATEAIEKISGQTMPTAIISPSPNSRGYRNRVTFHLRNRVERNENSRSRIAAKLGFFVEGSHDVVDVEHCLIASPVINEVRNQLFPALAWIDDAEIVIETSNSDSAVVIIRSLEPIKEVQKARVALTALVQNSPVIAGIQLVEEKSRWSTGDVQIDAQRVLAKAPENSPSLRPGHFRQVNDAVNQMLVERVRSIVAATEQPHVLELFSGTGNIAFALRDVVASLVGIEGDSYTTRAASEIARGAGLSHFAFAAGDLSQGFGQYVERALDEFNVVVLDPPREGAPEICRELVERDWKGQIVYVSCDPACLGRDLKILSEGGWELKEIEFFDMFPRTVHIETLAVLTRK